MSYGLSLGSIDIVPDDPLYGGVNLLVAIDEVQPGVLDAIGCQQGIRRLGDGLTAHLALDGHVVGAEGNLAGGFLGEGGGAQVNANEARAGAGSFVEGFVGGDLGPVVVGEDAVVDLVVIVLPVAGGVPRGSVAARTVVRDEEEASDGGNGGGCADEVDGDVAVNLEGLLIPFVSKLDLVEDTGGVILGVDFLEAADQDIELAGLPSAQLLDSRRLLLGADDAGDRPRALQQERRQELGDLAVAANEENMSRSHCRGWRDGDG
ncbi:hypothetical protein HJFPF1_06170 [Paramyrothecium foliicola]|nr:hypothetical protein HJFPF1_06170 [Paramyrothecium foliicola]